MRVCMYACMRNIGESKPAIGRVQLSCNGASFPVRLFVRPRIRIFPVKTYEIYEEKDDSVCTPYSWRTCISVQAMVGESRGNIFRDDLGRCHGRSANNAHNCRWVIQALCFRKRSGLWKAWFVRMESMQMKLLNLASPNFWLTLPRIRLNLAKPLRC